MRTTEQRTKKWASAFWELYFSVVFVSPAATVSFVLIWLAEKCLAVAPSIQLILAGTEWDSVAKVAAFFNVRCRPTCRCCPTFLKTVR